MNNELDITQLKNKLLINLFIEIPSSTKIKRVKKTGTIIEMSPEIEQGKYDISKYINYGDFNKTIYEFYTILTEKFSHCNLGIFYTNLKSLKVKVRNYNILDILSMALFNTLDAGNYNTKKNKLTLINESREEVRSIICHELLHMASTIETEHTTFSGFGQENKKTKKNVGMALNEGYTEYLNKKYFGSLLQSSYENEIDIAERLEFIIGENKMQELYFKADLNGLVDELSKYASREHVISIIKQLDRIQKNTLKSEIKENGYEEIRQDLAEIYIEQQRQLLEQGKISEETFFERNIVYANLYILQNVSLPKNHTLKYHENNLKIVGTDGITISVNLDSIKHDILSITHK